MKKFVWNKTPDRNNVFFRIGNGLLLRLDNVFKVIRIVSNTTAELRIREKLSLIALFYSSGTGFILFERYRFYSIRAVQVLFY